jgi:DNA recombination-dependent growth factor C
VLRKIKLTGQDQADTGAEEEPLAVLDAEFVLFTGTLRSLLEKLRKTLGGFAQAETV